MRLIAIDPGKFAGWCLLVDGKLERIGVVCDHRKSDPSAQYHQFAQLGVMFGPNAVVYETAVIYPGAVERDADQVRLAGLGGRLAGACAATFTQLNCLIVPVEPRTWKGTLPKSVCNDRTLAQCPEAGPMLEKLPKGQRNHAWDALGLGLWYAKRQRP